MLGPQHSLSAFNSNGRHKGLSNSGEDGSTVVKVWYLQYFSIKQQGTRCVWLCKGLRTILIFSEIVLCCWQSECPQQNNIWIHIWVCQFCVRNPISSTLTQKSNLPSTLNGIVLNNVIQLTFLFFFFFSSTWLKIFRRTWRGLIHMANTQISSLLLPETLHCQSNVSHLVVAVKPPLIALATQKDKCSGNTNHLTCQRQRKNLALVKQLSNKSIKDHNDKYPLFPIVTNIDVIWKLQLNLIL